MTTFVFANNVNTTLAGSIGAGATAITLASSENLPASIPAGKYFVLTLNDAATQSVYEIVYATAISGSTVTVLRAQEGTSAQSWLVGDFIFNGPTAGQMASFGTGSGGVTSFNTRTGDVTLEGSDVDTALGYTPADDAAVVHIAGTETITGSKTFSTNVNINTSGSTGSLTITDAGAHGANIRLNGKGAVTPGKTISAINGLLTILNDAVTVNLFAMDDNGNVTLNGGLTATTANFTASDLRLKQDVQAFEPRPLHRSLPFVGYTLTVDGSRGLGVIAQDLKRAEPLYTGTFEKDGQTYMSVDKASAAYEQAMWCGRELDRLAAKIEGKGWLRRFLERLW